MHYRAFGRTGLRVSELCLGTMTFGEDWTFGASREVSRSIFDVFCAAGGNFIDTANTYTYGTSENLIGEFVSSQRDYFVLSTKYSLSVDVEDPNGGGNHRKQMRQAIRSSLARLRTDYVDVFWLHVWDSVTAIEEVMRGLEDLVRSGRVLYIGISNSPAWVVSHANVLAELRGWSKFVGIQVEYNLIERTAERELLPMARALDLGILAWAPLAGGVLTGKYVLEGDKVAIDDTKRGDWLNADRLTRRSLQIAATLVDVAREMNRTPAQVALNWLRQRPGDVIPVIAGRTLPQMNENLGCLDFGIEPSQMARLDSASEIDLGFPHEFVAREPLQAALYGAKRHLFRPR